MATRNERLALAELAARDVAGTRFEVARIEVESAVCRALP